jgi:Caspase domain
MDLTGKNPTFKYLPVEGTDVIEAILLSYDNRYVITPSGRFDGSKGAQELMYFVKGETTIPLSAMFEKFYTPRLLKRILDGEKIDHVEVDVTKIKSPPSVKIGVPAQQRNLIVEDDKPSVRRYQMTSDKITLTVQADCPSDGVSEIRLFHNGKTLGNGTRNLVVEDDSKFEKTKIQSFDIQLVEGENSFRAIALNSEKTESQPDEILINYKVSNTSNTQNTEGGVTLHLVVIGINKYKNAKYNLNYATADATSFKEEITKVGSSIFSKTNPIFIGDEKATKAGIITELEKIKAAANPKDVFIFYYAGHGVLNEKKEFFLVPHDVTQLYGNDDALAQKGLSANQLQQFSKDIKAQKQLFILDACQSAGALDQVVAMRGAAEEKAIAQLARSTGTHWLTASGSEQFASEFQQLGHGTFTYVLLQALSGKADKGGDKKITVKELDTYLQEYVPELTAKYKGTPQYPASYGFGNDFPIGVVKN